MGYRAWRGPAGSLAGLEGHLGASRITQAHHFAYVNLPSGEYAGTPYNATASLIDDFDIQLHVRAASWTPTGRHYLLGAASSALGWRMNLETNGTPRFSAEVLGTGSFTHVSASASITTVATANEWIWLRVERVGTVLKFYTRPDEDTAWTQLGTNQALSGSINALTDGTGVGLASSNSIGTLATGGAQALDVARALIYEGTTLAQDFNPARAVTGQPSGFIAVTGEAWSFTGATYEVFYGLAAAPQTYYIAPTGSDATGAGTEVSPWGTLTKPASIAAPGDTILMRGGYYDEFGVSAAISVTLSGTADNPITIKSYAGEWAIIDGFNDPLHPRALDDGEGNGTKVLEVIGSNLILEDFEVRNGTDRLDAVGINQTWRGVVVRNNSNVGAQFSLKDSLIEECLFRDNYGVHVDGNTGNGMAFYGSSLLWSTYGVVSSGNTIRKCVSVGNSDDGMSPASTSGQLFEHNVVADNGRGTTGNGMGIKLGLDDTTGTNNIARYNLVYGNRANGFDTNTSQGVTVHNNTSYDNSTGFVLWSASGDLSDNDAFNNISHMDTSARAVGTLTTHTHNNGYTDAWTGGTDNTNVDPLFVSVDPASVSFLKLSEASPMRAAGTVVHQASDTDLGAIPYGEDFADGWDWRALLAAHPEVEVWPMPRTVFAAVGGVTVTGLVPVINPA